MTAAWPDFYIVGAPKAGTTSLYQYLAAHPDVFLPDQKELWLFGSDLDVRNRRRWTADDLPELYGAPRRARPAAWPTSGTSTAGRLPARSPRCGRTRGS